jgi:NAD(P)-dependent dehydrogenase (short-subunit alcohol dehydrogenase family)
MAGQLDGKVAVVTGGASGIGLATARRFADEGATVVVADIQTGSGLPGRYVKLDVGDASAWGPFVGEVVATEGGLDVIHLNAGVTTGEGDIRNLTDAQYERIMRVNVDGVVYGARAAAAAMAERGGGAIVATASVAGLIGFSADPIYTLTKHAVVGLVRALGPALAPLGVTVNAVNPGIVDTPLVPEEVKPLLEAGGMKLIPPSQIADAVVSAITSGRTGECWACLRDRANEPWTFTELTTI